MTFLLLMVMGAFSTAHAQLAETWQTGQKTSYAAGDDGAFQAGVAWPSPRFTDNADGTITDRLTGLIWLKNANCAAGATMKWSQALNFCNTLSSGSHGLTDGSVAGDWRLPNRKELMSLVDYSRYAPALPQGHPFSNVQSTWYWSATTGADDTFNAWVVNMNFGIVGSGAKTYRHYVWPVRGGQSGSLLPAAPTANAATSITTSGFQANWSSVSGATGYRLDVSTSSAFSSFVSGYNNLNVGNSTSRSVSGLNSGTTYYYRVRAYNAFGTGGNSNVISATTSEDNRIKGNLPFLPLLLE